MQQVGVIKLCQEFDNIALAGCICRVAVYGFFPDFFDCAIGIETRDKTISARGGCVDTYG